MAGVVPHITKEAAACYMANCSIGTGSNSGFSLFNDLQVLKLQGVEQFNPIGQQFDPNAHNALFEVPDPSKAPGTVASVAKVCVRVVGI
jgi:hypothetical protein